MRDRSTCRLVSQKTANTTSNFGASSRLEDSIPWNCEIAVAEVEKDVKLLYAGLNFSPTYDDPLSGTKLEGSTTRVYGIRSFLENEYVTDVPYVAVFHLTSPCMTFLDRGKTRLQVE